MKFVDYRGLDCTKEVLADIEESGLPLEFWQQFPEWNMPGFMGSHVRMYITERNWVYEVERRGLAKKENKNG